jgi:hypothetical protein
MGNIIHTVYGEFAEGSIEKMPSNPIASILSRQRPRPRRSYVGCYLGLQEECP